MIRATAVEVARQKALSRYALSEKASREAIERLAELITELLDIPSAQVNVINDRWQHTLADFNWAGPDLPREESFCTHTVQLPPGEEILEVPDTRLDARFSQHGVVTGTAALRYYAGTPLVTPDGHAIGTLCLLDREPRAPLTSRQRSILKRFATLIMSEMERYRAVAEVRLVFQEQLAHEARLKDLMTHTSDLVVIRDCEGRLLEANPAAVATLGVQMTRPGTTAQSSLEDSVYASTLSLDEEVMRTGTHLRALFSLEINGQAHRFDVTKFPLTLPNGEIGGVTSVARDITTHTELQQSLLDTNTSLVRQVNDQKRELQDLVHTDPLTGLKNRRSFELALNAALTRAKVLGSDVTLLVCDLDGFQAFNEMYGRDSGDELLKGFASALRQTFRPGTAIFRVGGDVFNLLVENADDTDLDAQVQDALLIALRRRERVSTLTVSTGTASFPVDTRGANDLLRLAEQRMLREKATRQVASHLDPSLTTDAPPPSATALQAIRSTLHLLTREGQLDQLALQGLLEAAVLSVPGAEAGSLCIREGRDFVFRAQVGFSDALVGMRQREQDVRTWYGETNWVDGRARLISGTDAVISRQHAAVQDEDERRQYERYGAFPHLKANISVPVVVAGEVLGTFNLDNMRDQTAFDDQALRLAEDFAVQAAALLAAARRLHREAARRRELEVMVRTGVALREATTLEGIEETLRLEARSLLNTQHVAVLRFTEDTVTWTSAASRAERQLIGGRAVASLRSALLTGRPQTIENVPELFNLQAMTLVPITASRDVSWGIVASPEAKGGFSASELEILTLIAGIGAAEIKRFLAERESLARVAELQLFADLPRLAGALDNPSDVAGQCLAACRTFLGADYALYLQIGHPYPVTDGSAPQSFLDAAALVSNKLASRATPEHRRSVRIATASYASHTMAVPALVNCGVHGLVLTPVIDRKLCGGYVAFVWFRPLTRLPSVAELLSDRVAELISRAHEREAFIQDLKDTHEGALLALGISLEIRDFETHGHTGRVVGLANALGQQLGMTPDELEGLRQGAYLHDVGKLGVPDSVLLKPGKLDADEWEVMKSHSTIGADMMDGIATIHPIARGVIRHHHERWDGAGYPHNLKGEEIPLAARLFSLVDVYDALVSERPYKKAWAPAEALTEIRKQAGAQFDPKLAEAFIALVQTDGSAAGVLGELLVSQTPRQDPEKA